MEKNSGLPTTQRAYTLRLRGSGPQDASWRENLWKTHEAVNKGAKAFGDWLLTMRGGLDHTLADEPLISKEVIDKEWDALKKEAKKKKTSEPDRDKAEEAAEFKRQGRIRDRRILLALSWLSVESIKGAPDSHFVSNTLDKSGRRGDWKTVDALEKILKSRGIADDEIRSWLNDCRASLSAEIREDAVWIDRSKAFDEAIKHIGNSFSRSEIWDFLEPFFASQGAYLAPIKETGNEDDEISSGADDEKAKDLVQKAGQWLSSRFGVGKGADFTGMTEVYKGIAEWSAKPDLTGSATIESLAIALSNFKSASNDLKGVLALISGPGYKSATRNILSKINGNTVVTQADLDKLKETAKKDFDKCGEKTGSKGKRPYADRILDEVEPACGFTYLQQAGPARHAEFSVMLDHAARRVSLAHTWIKRAEAERRQFEEDANKINRVPADVKRWLDRFCEIRSHETGSLEAYRIRRRAVDGWKDVVKEWSKSDCKTEADRIAGARSLQDDKEIEKFGDIQLFEALASDDAVCVWKINDRSDPQPLLDYVAATDAEAKQHRFKVPAYRHPDALLHPVFCDFGNSRWNISFAMHKAARKGEKPADNHAFSMKLWTGSEVKEVGLCWQSKLLDEDLPFPETNGGKTVTVTRAGRLGRAAAGAPKEAVVNIAGLFEQEDWNGRLQAPRAQLEELSKHIEKHGWTDRARSMRDRIRWLVTFSAKLQPVGPWINYVAKFSDDAHARPFVSRKGGYAVKHQSNDSRQGLGKLILSRLPDLRLLSVDLGHRYAAACAVWEAQSQEQIRDACLKAGVEPPKEGAMYLHLKSPEGKKTAIYRRIGSDTVEEIDKTTGESMDMPHSAPWARLDRQFLIKLQGEKEDARKASPVEIEAVLKLERELGCVDKEKRSRQVDELTSETVRSLRLALRRHGDRARIACNLTAIKKSLPGGREENLTEEGRVGLLTDTLVLWHDLFTAKNWTDVRAKVKWDEYIKPLLNDAELPQTTEDTTATSKERKKQREELSKKLKPIAEKLAQNEPLRMKLHVAWATQWREDDESLKKNLRWLRDWIMPRGRGVTDRSIRNVGGLSLTRIATIKSLYQVQKAYRMRPEPDDLRKNVPARGDDSMKNFGQSILDAMEHMRENRVKQLASRIAEAALGIGIEQDKVNKKNPQRPRERIDNPRFAPCHAVVIENLTHYRPEETRTRRENRQLMDWSAAKVKKYLSEACELNGLHLREVQAGYTSRQDSRTGAPGMRCSDIPVAEFVRQGGYLSKRIKTAQDNVEKGKGSAEELFLCEAYVRWDDNNKSWKDTDGVTWTLGKDGKWIERNGKAPDLKPNPAPKPVRIPQRGGEIFVSADGKSTASKGIQADLNAAANIGLRALLDPDWKGRWWYVPCDAKEFKPVADKVKGSTVFQDITALKSIAKKDNQGDSESTGKKKGMKKDKTRDIVNLWRDPSTAKIANNEWKSTPEYWNQVQSRVMENLRQQAKSEPDDIPF